MLTNAHRFHLLLHSGHLVEEKLRRRLMPLGIKPRQARVLDALYRLGSASQVELARRFDVTPASMSSMTSRLIKAGFLVKEHDRTELRSNVLRLTDSGHDMLAAIHATWDEMDLAIESAIGATKARALAELTRELRNALGGRAPHESS